MKIKLRNHRILFAGLLGAAVLAGSPLFAQADQGKWWDPKQGGQETRNRDGRDGRGARDGRDGWDGRGDRGQQRTWGTGPRFQRDIVVIRDGNRGPRYRAHRIWVRPTYFRRQHLIAIRPVRYFFNVSIGGGRFQARFQNHDHFVYGCNFCDARFDNYNDYRRHVLNCEDRPSGYRLDVCDWDDQWSNQAYDYDCHNGDNGGYDNGGYDDGRHYDGGYDNDYNGDRN